MLVIRGESLIEGVGYKRAHYNYIIMFAITIFGLGQSASFTLYKEVVFQTRVFHEDRGEIVFN